VLLLTFPLGNLVLSVRILIVEDDEKIGALICQMMAGAGYVTTHAKTGESFWIWDYPAVMVWRC
jgi:CheY-like chemotaxis protein